jgi:hypothetical protein
VAIRWVEEWLMSWAAGFAAAFGLGFALPLTAAAQDADSPQVTTQVDACVPIDREQFDRVLAIELGTSIQYTDEASRIGSVTFVQLSCTAGGVQLQLDDKLTHKSMSRVVDVSHVAPHARSRLLALAVAEFVVASWVELELPDSPGSGAPVPDAEDSSPEAPASAAAAVQAESLDAARATVSRVVRARLPRASPLADRDRALWQLGAALDVMTFSSALQPIPGLGLRLEHRPAAQLAFHAALDIGHANLEAVWRGQNIGSVQLTSTSVLLSLLYLVRIAELELSVGAGARVGLAHMAGSTTSASLEAQSFYAPFGGPVIALGMAYRFGAHPRLFVELEGGAVTQAAQSLVENAVVMQLNGVWLAGALGFAWAL